MSNFAAESCVSCIYAMIKNRKIMNIKFPDGSSKQFEAGVNAASDCGRNQSATRKDVLAATVNGEEWDLTRPIVNDAEIKLFKWDDPEGKHAFWHTSAHLLAEALQELYPALNSVSVRRLRTDSIMI